MRRSRALGSFVLTFLPLACAMDNPAFEDERGDELGDDSSSDESTTRETDESDDATDDTTDSSSSDDDATTQTSSTLDTTSTSEDTSEEDTSETTEGMTCAEGLTDCEGRCVNLGKDPLNCGTCGMQCADNQVCAGGCLLAKYVFVSSDSLTGAMGGILVADEFCASLAFEATLPGTYLAWNSTDLSFPDVDFVKEGAYVRTDGEIVATSYADLTDGSLAMPINLDENGSESPALASVNCPNVFGPVWSNTTPGGEYAGGTACTGWFSGNNLITGKIGSSTAVGNSWSEALGCNVPCGTSLPIYCVQQDP
jgi:hypothetical protein